MGKGRSRIARLLIDRWFLVGTAFGLLAVLPTVALQFGLGQGDHSPGWATLPGFIARLAMLFGIWCYDGKFAWPAILLGVIANGLAYAVVGVLNRNLWKVARSTVKQGTSGPSAEGSNRAEP